MLFIDSLFGKTKKPEQEDIESIEFTKEVCKQEVRNPNEGTAYIKCGKTVIKNIKTGKKSCSVNEMHNISGEGPPL